MKPYYELYSDYEDNIVISKRNDYTFPPHFHGSLEILILLKGKYKVNMDDKTYTAEGKSVVVSDSFCLHAFSKISPEPSDSMLIIIPSAKLKEFAALKNGKALTTSIVTDENIVSEISVLTENMMKHGDNEVIKEKYANLILALFVSSVGLSPISQQKNATILKNVLLYIADNYKEDISLKSIAYHFGYSESHISRLFHSYFRISISRYINNMRIEYIEANKKNDEKILSLIYKAGFKSPQTYYRNLKYYKKH